MLNKDAILPIHKLFEEQIYHTPDEIAVEFNGEYLTYDELNQRANQLASYLLLQNISKEARIGLFLERSLETIVGILAIFKAGATYLPLDPAYPEKRLAYLLEDADCQLIVTKSEYETSLPSFSGKKVFLDIEESIIEQKTENIDLEVSPRQVAYIIYTSGSQGEPKGVLVEHTGWHNLARSRQKAYGLQPGERLLQFSSLNWDTSLEEVFPTITGGATLVLRPPDMLDSFSRFCEYCDSLNITVLSLPTAFWHDLVSYLAASSTSLLPDKIRVVITGGERVQAEIVNQWHSLATSDIQLFNTYGQTECSAITTRCLLPAGKVYDSVPIGHAIENIPLLLLDEKGEPVSEGDPGELYVGGVCVGRGYLNRPELTAEKFVNLDSGRFFRTGDIVRKNSDGLLEYIGRVDSQLKIRGIRIEPGDVEAVLLKHPKIKLAVAVGQPIEQPRKLVAYLVLENPDDDVPPDLRTWLKQHLADAFIPSMFIVLDTIPLTTNGKVDKRALPVSKTTSEKKTSGSDLPTTETERTLLSLWRDYLNNPQLGIHDDFFENGGDSLIVMQIVTEIEKKTAKNLPFGLIFSASTVAKLAARLDEQDEQSEKSIIVPVKTAGKRPPLFAVHADGGAFFYLDFAKYLDEDQPFYGLQARGLDAGEEPFRSLKEMIAYYIHEIQTVQPHGPYLIGGFSVGGIFAYEMAQQLIAQGEQVDMLAMFDAEAPGYPVYQAQGDKKSGKLKRWLSKNPRDFIVEGFKRTQRKIEKKTNDLAIDLYDFLKKPLTPDLRIHLVRKLNQGMGARYQPEEYTSAIHVFHASEQEHGILPDNTLGWKKYVTGPIHTHVIPGDHETIFKEPQVGTLAQTVQKALNELDDKGGGG